MRPLLLLALAISGCAAAPAEDMDKRWAEKQRSYEACVRAEELARARLEKARADLSLLEARVQSLAVAASLAPEPVPVAAPGRVREVAVVEREAARLALDPGALFARGSAVLRAGAAPILDNMARELATPERKDLQILVQCRATARVLAGERALVLLRELETRGVAPERLIFAGALGRERVDVILTRKERQTE